jgi:allantoicase
MDDAFTALPDLASRALGGAVVHCDDEFFAAADHLVLPTAPRFTPHHFDHKGQIYDGWETRRRRTPGSDAAIIRLGVPGVIRGLDIDTAFFIGNYPPFAWVDGLAADGPAGAAVPGLPATGAAMPGLPATGAGSADGPRWTPLLPKSPLAGDTRNLFVVEDRRRFTHVRLTIHPDGGVARFRVHGEAVPDPRLIPEVCDVAALAVGARLRSASNMFFSHPQHMLMPGLAQNMGDGWETARRREPGNEWAVIDLAAPTEIAFVAIDTTHFKGNAPGAAALRGSAGDDEWFDILPRVPLAPDTPHRFPIASTVRATRVRLDIFPDGGVARLRVIGRPDRGVLEENFRRHTENR